MTSWRKKVWESWGAIKWTPVPLAILLGVARYNVPEIDDTNIIIDIWIFFAIGSVTFISLLKRKTGRLVRIAESDLRKSNKVGDEYLIQEMEDSLIHTKNLDSCTAQYLVIHCLFLALGLSAALTFIPDRLQSAIAISSLLTGQYILFLVAIRSYLAIVLAWRKPKEGDSKP